MEDVAFAAGCDVEDLGLARQRGGGTGADVDGCLAGS